MGENSKIEWCDHTMNFWEGCTQISRACDHCYAKEMVERYGRTKWGNHPRRRTAPQNWRKLKTWTNKARSFEAKYGRPQRVFVNSLSDFFDNQVDPDWRQEAWEAMLEAKPLIFMLLTRRPENIEKMLPPWFDKIKRRVWIGVTFEHMDEFKRVNILTGIDCAVRFLSCLLLPASGIDFVIAGGESGPHARPWHPTWELDLRTQCNVDGIPYFWKQNGTFVPCQPADRGLSSIWVNEQGETLKKVSEMPSSTHTYRKMARVGKLHSGYDINGEVFQDLPAQAFEPV